MRTDFTKKNPHRTNPLINKMSRIYFHFLFSLVVSMFCHSMNGQIMVNPSKIAFGDFGKQSEKIVDIIVENKTGKSDFLLRSVIGVDFEVKFTTKTLDPYGQMVIRLQFNPRQKGEFREVIELYFASMTEPLKIPVTANVQYVNINGNTPCPDFGTRPPDCCSSNWFIVEVYDAQTLQPIEKARVRIEEDGYIHLNLQTTKEGKVSQTARIGFYSIVVDKKGYKAQTQTSYINNLNGLFKFYLERDASFEEKEEVIEEVVIEETDPIEEEVAEPMEESATLPESQFAPNNVVFLLDISGSMGIGDKLDLMKYSLSELVSILRGVDKVALISYANEAKILQASTSGSNKSELLNQVENINTGGKTSGAKGFKRSFQMLQKNKIEGGNNQLIVITDGAFAIEDQKAIEKLVKKYQKKGYTTTVVGIKANSYAKDNLEFVSELGNGSFLQIEDKSSAEAVLIEELKKKSAK